MVAAAAAASQGRRTHQCCIVTHVRSMLLRARVYISASRICRNVSCRLDRSEAEPARVRRGEKRGKERRGAARRGETRRGLVLGHNLSSLSDGVEAAVASDRLRTISAALGHASAFLLYLRIIMRPASPDLSREPETAASC